MNLSHSVNDKTPGIAIHMFCMRLYQNIYCIVSLCLILSVFVFQIEDAMLMFDKQTNRHRGKFGLFLSPYYCIVIIKV